MAWGPSTAAKRPDGDVGKMTSEDSTDLCSEYNLWSMRALELITFKAIEDYKKALKDQERAHAKFVKDASEKHEKQERKLKKWREIIDFLLPFARFGLATRRRFFSKHAAIFVGSRRNSERGMSAYDKETKAIGNHIAHAGDFPVEDAMLFLPEKCLLSGDLMVAACDEEVDSQIRELLDLEGSNRTRNQGSGRQVQRHDGSGHLSPWMSNYRYRRIYGADPAFVLKHRGDPDIIKAVKCHGYYAATTTLAPRRTDQICRCSTWEKEKKAFMHSFNTLMQYMCNIDEEPRSTIVRVLFEEKKDKEMLKVRAHVLAPRCKQCHWKWTGD